MNPVVTLLAIAFICHSLNEILYVRSIKREYKRKADKKR